MAAKQEINKNTANNMNCSLCTKFIKILKHKPEGEIELKCDECSDDNDPVVALCADCTLCLCKDCNKVHQKKNKEHDMISLDKMPQPSSCSEHPGYKIEHYCKTCDKFSCLYCAMSHHVGEDHDNDIIEKMAYKHRKLLCEIIAPVEEMSDNLSKAEANIVSTQEKIKEQASDIDREIDKSYAVQLEILKEHHEQLKQQLNKAVLQKQKALNEQLKEIKLIQDKLDDTKELHEDIKKALDCKILSTKKEDIESRMQKVSNLYKHLNILPVESDTMMFDPFMQPLKLGQLYTDTNNSEILGSVPKYSFQHCCTEFRILAKDRKGCNCTKGGSQVCVQLKSFTGDVTVGEVRDNNDGSYMASFVAEQVGEAKLSVAINGEQIKGSPYSIVVGRNYQAIDKPSKIVNNNGNMGAPWGVAFGRNGLWAVADGSNHCVYVFDDKDQLVRKFGSNGSNNGQFSSPLGVAFDSHNHLYVVDNGNHRVQKFDTTGNYLLQFGSKGAIDGQLDNPYSVTVLCDKAYVADYNNRRISVFQINGKFCITFGSDQLGGPKDLAVSADNHLLVADYKNSYIYTFTLDGHYIGKFSTPGSGRGQLDRPYGITTDLNGFIIVADTCIHRISIFYKNDCIRCFGSCGSANGQFNNLYGVALSPNGSIYVSDHGNKGFKYFAGNN